MKFLDETKLSFFDSGFPSTQMSLLTGSNVYNLGGYNGAIGRNTDLDAVSYTCIWYSQLISTVARLADYRAHDLTKTVLGLYKDAVSSCINSSANKLVEIEGNSDYTDLINRELLEMDYLSILKADLCDMIYYGSTSHKLEKVDKDKIKIIDFKFPFNVGYIRERDKYIVMSSEGPKEVRNLLRFSFDDLSLDIDDDLLVRLGIITQSELDDFHKDKSNIYSFMKVTAGEPLFLSTETKLKDYVLKDLVSTYLSIINLIQQDTFTIDGSRMADMANLLNLCDRVKGMLVTQDDMNLLASARLDKTALIRRLFDRIRVIPSIGGELNNLNKMEGSNVKERLDLMLSQKENVRDELLTAIGFPLDLFKGSTNKWEVTRQNDRYSTKIVDINSAIKKSTVNNVITIGDLYNLKIDRSKVKVLFMQETPYEISNSTEKINKSRELIQSASDILRSATELVNLEGLGEENSKEVVNTVNQLLKKAGIEVTLKVKEKEQAPESREQSGNRFGL